MRSSLILLFLVSCVSAISVSEASAAFCKAESNTGSSGWGRSSSVGRARGIALRECAVRTPRRGTCYIMYCNR